MAGVLLSTLLLSGDGLRAQTVQAEAAGWTGHTTPRQLLYMQESDSTSSSQLIGGALLGSVVGMGAWVGIGSVVGDGNAALSWLVLAGGGTIATTFSMGDTAGRRWWIASAVLVSTAGAGLILQGDGISAFQVGMAWVLTFTGAVSGILASG